MSDDMIFDCFTCDAVDKISEQETEITRLRADLAAVTEERDRMREALKPFADRHKDLHSGYEDGIAARDYPTVFVFVQDLRRARAALEGVTNREGAGNE